MKTNLVVWSTLAAMTLTACGGGKSDRHAADPSIPEGTSVTLALMETTDIHASVMSYDYYTQQEDTSVGLERTSALVNAVRAENPNNLLFDNGDTLVGNLMGDLQTLVQPVGCDGTMAVHKVMNAMKYDAGGLGDHEFNFGLSLLSQITNTDLKVIGISKPAGPCGGPNFPLVLTNVTGVTLGRPILPATTLLPRSFAATAPDGSKITVNMKIGVMSFVPPQIMEWDKDKLDGKIVVGGVQEAAQKYVPELRKQGADVVVALSHGGLDTSPYSAGMENGSYYLAGTGIDALMIGHSQLIFPQAKEAGGPALDATLAGFPASAGIDGIKGLVKGVPTVMAQSWGRRLGIIKITLVYTGGKWVVQPARTSVEARGFNYTDGKTVVAADPAIAALVTAEHAATQDLVQQSLGVGSDFELASYFALAGDVGASQLVNQAQLAYVKRAIASSASNSSLTAYKAMPVISASALFKAGKNGASDYTDVPGGDLLVRYVGDLYPVGTSTVHAVHIKGADLKLWLETSASQFATIDPARTTEQDLVPSFASMDTVDVFYGEDNALNYWIDVSRPAGDRIVSLSYQGKDVLNGDDFIVATSEQRALGAGHVPGLDGSKTVLRSLESSQTLLRNYLVALGASGGAVTQAVNGSARSWNFAPVETAGPVVLRSAPGHLDLAQASTLDIVTAESEAGSDGYARYTINLSQHPPADGERTRPVMRSKAKRH